MGDHVHSWGTLQHNAVYDNIVRIRLVPLLIEYCLVLSEEGRGALSKTTWLVVLVLLLVIVIPSVAQKPAQLEVAVIGNDSVNTVLGKVRVDELGITLMHEHLIGDWEPLSNIEQQRKRYQQDVVVATVAPLLSQLKEAGGGTIVDCNPHGFGRDVLLYKALAEASGLNVIASTGVFAADPKYVPDELRGKSAQQIADLWIEEFDAGIEGTGIRPSVIKLALSDNALSGNEITYLTAAAITSCQTGMPINCHILVSSKAEAVVNYLKKQGLPLSRFIWAHADYEANIDVMARLAKEGIWLEVDSGWKGINHRVQVIKALVEAGVVDHVVTSQDFTNYYVTGSGRNMYPFDQLLRELVPRAKEAGISDEVLEQILIHNPRRVFTGE